MTNKLSDSIKTLGQQSGSAKGHLDSVENLFKQVETHHDIFKAELETLTKDMHILKERIKNNPSQIRKYVAEKLNRLEDDTILSEEQQRHENRSIQEAITQIKRENGETRELIVKTVLKLKELEVKVGQY